MGEWFQDAAEFGIRLTDIQVQQFSQYMYLIKEWNERFNLTAISDNAGIQRKHFLDSLSSYAGFRDVPIKKIVDIGTGAGFPGIPLKIAFPNLEATLVESIGKKVEFCKLVIHELGLNGIRVIHGRAEEIGADKNYREQFDLSIARAVAIQSTLMEYLLPLVRLGGLAIAQKGQNARQETLAAESAIQKLGGKLKNVVDIHVPGLADERFLVTVDKIAATPDKYPRRVGVASKRPL